MLNRSAGRLKFIDRAFRDADQPVLMRSYAQHLLAKMVEDRNFILSSGIQPGSQELDIERIRVSVDGLTGKIGID